MSLSAATIARVTRPADRSARQGLAVLFAAQALATGATIVSTSLGSIVAARLTGTESLAGLPSTLNMLAAALAAVLAGRLMAARGRRLGLSVGYAVGAAGAILAGLMALQGSFAGFLVGSAMVGVASGVVQQGRYAAAELVPPAVRGRVVGRLLSGSVLGALLASALTPAVTFWAARTGWGAIELGWILGGILLAAGSLLVGLGFNARPLEPAASPGPGVADEPRSWPELVRDPQVRLALVSLGVGQGVMVMLMVLTPLRASHLGHGLPTISTLLSAHFAGMFGLAWLTGSLADAWGRPRTILLGSGLLAAAALIAAGAEQAPALGLSLFLLGLGWNLCFVAGSALIADRLRPAERARAQGGADLVVWSCAAAGALGGGVIVANLGYPAVAWLGLLVSLVPALLIGVGRLEPARA